MTSGSPQRQPSMVDVAREAGVAHVTVSRVLNGHPSVRPETRRAVLEAVEKLGYQRNDLARILKSGRSRTIGVVIAGSELFELPRILHGVEDAAYAAGYQVNLASWQGGGGDRLSEAVRRMTEQAVEGIAIIADRPIAVGDLEKLVTRVPVSVVMSGEISNLRVNSVELDQRYGAELVVEHLWSLGHRSIAHLTGRLSVYDAHARLEGWRTAMSARGAEAPIWLEGDFSARSGFELAVEILEHQDAPTAIFAGNDLMAMGVLSACTQKGVAVPSDISVVGFDDLAGSEFLIPSLTTVRQDFFALGSTSVEKLVANIAGEPAGHHLIQPRLLVRGSTEPPRQI